MKKKVGIIGVGNVGATLAFSLANKDICSEIVLKDIKHELVEAMALDISQASHVSSSHTHISFATEDKDFCDCDIIVITAGIARKPGMSRDDLLLTNANIVSMSIKNSLKNNPNAIYIIVSNPLDVMVYVALKASNLPRERVLGMAGILDSARMCHFIEEKLDKKSKNIDAWVMGGHGDDMVPLPEYSSVDGVKLTEILDQKDIEDIIQKTKLGGAQIVKLLKTGSAYYAPAHSTSLMVEAIIKNSNQTFPCAILLEGEYGYEDVVAGVPITIGENGLEKIKELKLTPLRKEQFKKSVNSVRDLIDVLQKKFF